MADATPNLEVFTNASGPPSADLALEAWMVERAAAGQSCVLVCSWARPAVVLGYGQPPEDVDLQWCRSSGIPVLRRITGGTGVVHHRDLCVSLALPASHPWAKGITQLYERFLEVLEPALNAAGGKVARMPNPERATRERSPICFEDRTSDTLLSDGRKVVGCAQTRRSGAVLIHAAILLGLDAELYSNVFRVSAERVLWGLAPAVPGGQWREVGSEVVRHMAGALECDIKPTPVPRLAEEYVRPYSTSRWAPVPDV